MHVGKDRLTLSEKVCALTFVTGDVHPLNVLAGASQSVCVDLLNHLLILIHS